MPTELDGLIDLSNHYIVDCLFFRHVASCWWNQLPDDIVTSTTFPSVAYDYLLTGDGWLL